MDRPAHVDAFAGVADVLADDDRWTAVVVEALRLMVATAPTPEERQRAQWALLHMGES